MPAATTKDDLLTVTKRDYAKLDASLDGVRDDQAVWRDHSVAEQERYSVRELIAHRAHWIGLYLSWYQDGLAGLDVKTPAPGYKWNQLKAYNAFVYATARDHDWRAVLDWFRRRHMDLLEHLEALDNHELYSKHLYPWMNDWTLGRWAEASGASHYRSAAKHVRKLLRDMA